MNATDSSKTKIEALALHDATLESAAFDWKSGELRLVLDITGEETMAVLSFSETTRFNATRERPWGPSVSINKVREPSTGTIEVQIQSGDVWVIQAASWALSFPLRGEA
jgi:hypothetical protein